MRRNPTLAWKTGAGRILIADDLDTVTREEIERIQEYNFETMVKAVRTIPVVRERFLGLEYITKVNQIRQLPLMSPDVLASSCPPQSNELLLDSSELGIVLRSSGTSGRAKVVYHSWSFNRRVGLLGARGVRSALSELPVKIANCMQPGELNDSFTFCQDICQLLRNLRHLII